MKNLFKVLFLSFVAALSFTACSDDDNCPDCGGNVDNTPLDIYILNEGNMTDGNGRSLHHIDAQGQLHENVFATANEGRKLGNVTQDLFIRDGKIYVVSQNGDTEGNHINVMDEKNFKSVADYRLGNGIDWPSHIAVFDDEHIYVRDNKGIWCFNATTKEAVFVEGTKGAMKKPMLIMGDKLIAAHNGNNGLMVITKGATKAEFPSTLSQISGLAKAWDGNLWVSTQSVFGEGKSAICKVSSRDFSVIAEHEIKEVNIEGATQGGASATIYAYKDMIYYCLSGSGYKNDQKIWRHNFAKNETVSLSFAKIIDKGNIVYNGFAAHPVTGQLLLGSVKGYGNDYLTNSLFLLEDKGTELEVKKQLGNNPVPFQAGTFFRAQFE